MPFVCEKCIGDDPGLQQFIKDNGEFSNTCNYCNIQITVSPITQKFSEWFEPF